MAHAYGPTWVIVLHHLWYLMLMRNSVTYLILRRTVGYTNHQRFHHYNRGTYSRSISCRQSIGYKFDQVWVICSTLKSSTHVKCLFGRQRSLFFCTILGALHKNVLCKVFKPWTTNQLIQLLVNQLPFVTIVVCNLACPKLQLIIVVFNLVCQKFLLSIVILVN